MQGVFDYGGGKFSGYDKDPNVDEYERKEALRLRYRGDINETLQELGEGRGEPFIQSFGVNFSNHCRHIWSRLSRKTSR